MQPKVTRILQASDLHIPAQGSDVAYAWGVWEEILAIAASDAADLLLITGDLFDTYAAFSQSFQKWQASLDVLSCPIVYLIGNHERLGAPAIIPPLDIQHPNLHVLIDEAEWIPMDKVAVWAKPHGCPWPDLTVPEALRLSRLIGAVHGQPAHYAAFASDDEEEGGETVPEAALSKLPFSLICCGHIHKRADFKHQQLTFHYPGSARVWRRTEQGPRQVSLITVPESGPVTIVGRELTRAGQVHTFPLTLPRETASILEEWKTQTWHPNDQVQVVLQGYRESVVLGRAQQDELAQWLSTRVRKVKWLEQGLIDMSEVQGHPMMIGFFEQLQLWVEQQSRQGATVDPLVLAETKALGIKVIQEQIAEKRDIR